MYYAMTHRKTDIAHGSWLFSAFRDFYSKIGNKCRKKATKKPEKAPKVISPIIDASFSKVTVKFSRFGADFE